MTKNLLKAAVVTAVIAPGAAFAGSVDNTVTVSLQVEPMILLHVSQNNLVMNTTNLTQEELDSTYNDTPGTGRAEFWVSSNTEFKVALDVPASDKWSIDNEEKIKFFGSALNNNTDAYIAGTVFLDTDMSIPQTSSNGLDIQPWTGNGIEVQQNVLGVHRYGIGAIFDPQTWHKPGKPDETGLPNGVKSIAPADTYSNDIVITVSTI